MYSQAVQQINSGQVKKVTIVANKATLELQNSDKQQTTLPERPEAFEKLLQDYNTANPVTERSSSTTNRRARRSR